MGKIMRNGKKYSGASSSMAENIVYDNTESGLEANDVQGAVDELSEQVSEQNKNLDNKLSGEFVLLYSGSPSKQSTYDLNESVKNFKFLVVKSGSTGSTIIPIQEIDEIRDSSAWHTICGTNGELYAMAYVKFKTDTTVYFDNVYNITSTRIYGVK